MLSVYSPIREMTPEEYRRVTEVTYLGYVCGTLAALKRMRPRDRGTIIQIGSSLAYVSIPIQSAYCAAKHAVRGFTSSLRDAPALRHASFAVRFSRTVSTRSAGNHPACRTPGAAISFTLAAHRAVAAARS